MSDPMIVVDVYGSKDAPGAPKKRPAPATPWLNRKFSEAKESTYEAHHTIAGRVDSYPCNVPIFASGFFEGK
jgi:hypothetical protein